MRINKDGTIWLEEGEPVPVVCRCRYLYAPPLDSEVSDCPRCGRENVHGMQLPWKPVKPGPRRR